MPVRPSIQKILFITAAILVLGGIWVLSMDHWIWSLKGDPQTIRRWLIFSQLVVVMISAGLLGWFYWRSFSRSNRHPTRRPVDEWQQLQADLEAGWVIDHRGRILYVSDGLCRLLDMPVRALLGRPFKDLIHPTSEAAFGALASSDVKK